jgi:hypothetical protein
MNVLDDSGDKPTGQKETAEATQRLLTRPSLEDTETQVRSVVEQIAAAGSQLMPGTQWYWHRDRTPSGCNKPYDQTDGRIVYLQNYVSDTPVPDDVWPVFLERSRAITAQIGATAPETMPGKAGNYEVWFSNPDDGTTIKVGSQAATVISAIVGCHLPRDGFTTPPRPTS